MITKITFTKYFLFCLIFSSFSIIYAQEKKSSLPPPLPVTDDENCGLKTDLIKLDVSVWSSEKGFLQNLNHKDFEIYDEGEKRDIEFFSKKDEPISVGILFDLSGSMEYVGRKTINEIPSGVEGLVSFINNSNPNNEYLIVGFSANVEVLSDLTQDRKEIGKTVNNILTAKPEGNTSFFDALKVGYEKISKGKFDRKILIVFSDGMDTNSVKNKFKDIDNINRKENILLYMVNFVTDLRDRDSMEGFDADKQVTKLTQNSGGKIFYAKNRTEVVGSFEWLAEELKNQYVVGFNPDASPKKDKWRDLKLKFVLPKEKRKEFGKIIVGAANGYRSQ